MGKSILEEAVDDVQALRKAAEENAKNLLIESVSPRIKDFIQSHLGEGVDGPEGGSDPAPDAGEQPHDAPEGDEEGGDDDESLYDIEGDDDEEVEDDDMSESEDGDDDEEDDDDEEEEEMDESVNEASDDDNSDPESDDDKSGWDKFKKKKKKGKKMADCDESVEEVTQEDLLNTFNEVLKGGLKEAGTTHPAPQGSFKDQQDPNDGEYGITHKIPGDTHWSHAKKVLKKAKKAKMVTKEAHEKVVQNLQRQLAQYQEAFKYLKKNLNEMNLFNAKLVYTTRLMQNNLTNKQKMHVMEAIDKARTPKEAAFVANTLSESFKIAGVLGSGRKQVHGSKAQRTTGKPSSTLTEGKTSTAGVSSKETDRWAQLAGLMGE